MSEYKKKSVKRKPIKQDRKDYPMKSSSVKEGASSQKNNIFKLHTGKKRERRLSVFISTAVIIVIAAVYFIILAFHPIGVSEYFSSKFKIAGKGDGYPVELKGDDVLMVNRQDKYYYTITESSVYCNNMSGKLVSSITHGFARPVLRSAETRYIIFGQGEQTVKVFNFERELHNLHYDSQILSVAITDNGYFAVATTVDGYDSKINVYDKNGKVIFEWYSSNGIVGSLNFSSNGKKLLVTTFSTKDGEFESKALLLDFKSANPEKTFVFEKNICYKVGFLTKETIFVVFENSIQFIKTKDGSIVTNEFDYSVKLAEATDNYILISGNLDSNTDSNRITLYNKKTECIADFTVSYNVKEAIYKNKHIYLLSNNLVNCYNLEGVLLYSAPVTFDVRHIVPVSEKSLVAVSNKFISQITLAQSEQ